MRKITVFVALLLVFSFAFAPAALAWGGPIEAFCQTSISVIVGKIIAASHTPDINDASPGVYNGQRGYWTRYGEFIPAVN